MNIYLNFLLKNATSPIVNTDHKSQNHFSKTQWLPYNNSKVKFENPPPLDFLNPGLLKHYSALLTTLAPYLPINVLFHNSIHYSMVPKELEI
jgi:hypothetical protein